MYDIRQFKPALYLLLILGMTGFAIAFQSAGIWVLGCAAVVLNAWLVRTGRYTPMPRLVANLITIVALLYVIREGFASATTAVMVIGEFLVLLQIVKLYEVRGNRDYGQLLVLGLLMMVAASINTASLFFGILLIVYLFLSLYCCLLFHLKIEADAAKAAFAVPEEKFSAAMLRQDQRYLTQSMRRLTTVVSCVAIVFAVLVFLLFPRGTGAGLLGQLQFRQNQTLVGFSDQVDFQQVAKIQQNREIVAYVRVAHNGKPVDGTRTLLWRGVTLDRYNGMKWTRSPTDETPQNLDREQRATLRTLKPGSDQWEQDVTLRATGSNVLFAMGGPSSFAPGRPLRLRFGESDGALQTAEPLTEQLQYRVISSEDLGPAPAGDLRELADQIDQPRDLVSEWADEGVWPFGRGPFAVSTVEKIKLWAHDHKSARFEVDREIDPKVGEFARQAEVSGSDAQGPLVGRRGVGGIAGPLDDAIAGNIERYLRTHFKFTLDLTDSKRIAGRDPIVTFLYDLKRGHCEYFAGAMTLMCQSLGMQARMVVGFKTTPDEYNGLGKYYVVRESAAHAWVEVRTPDGWHTFDPTSDNDADSPGHKGGLWQKFSHLLDFVEFTYANKVIAFDNQDQENLIQNVENKMLNLVIRGRATAPERWRPTLSFWVGFWKISSTLLGAVVWLMVLAVIVALLVFLWEKWTLRRRAARMGIGSLPLDEQMRLARQLGFYDDLMLLLARHRIVRPAHLTPREFGESLLFLPSDAYQTVLRLTKLFYRVRFGRAEMSLAQRRRLETVIAQLDGSLRQSRGET